MAHFAEIDDNNVVVRIVVIDNAALLDESGNENESLGKAECLRIFGEGRWVQTSYNNQLRRRFAGIGYTYDEGKDAFISPKPSDNHVLNPISLSWYIPNKPEFKWDEDQSEWVLVEWVDPNLFVESYHSNPNPGAE